MQEWLVAAVSLIGSTLITTIFGFVVKHLLTKNIDNYKDLQRLREQENNDRIEQQLEKLLDKKLKPIEDKIEFIDDMLKKVGSGTLSSLRNDILTCYYRCQEKGYRNDYDYQNIHELYESYDELHGNSFIHDIMNRFDKLPVKEEVKQIDAGVVSKKSRKKVLLEEDTSKK